MKKIVYVALLCSLLSVFTGCDTGSSPSHVDARRAALSVMAKADSLMRTRPDSALKLLYSIAPSSLKASPNPSKGRGETNDQSGSAIASPLPLEGLGEALGEGWGEAYYLLLLDAQNKCDTVFRSDTLQRALVSYYDRHGTPNERMRAYYLLGRACHDMGEAPRALDCYQQAIDCADTTSTDCDYYTLCRVHSQIANIFAKQMMPQSQLIEENKALHYAYVARDTISGITNLAHIAAVYYKLHKPDSAILKYEEAAGLYEYHGNRQYAAMTLGGAIRPLIEGGNYQKAKKYLIRYEKDSGRILSNGSIAPGCEVYYFLKGLYYLHTNSLDSAEYYFRRELKEGKDINNQIGGTKGLCQLFSRKNNTHSLAKYSQLYSQLNDSAYSKDVAHNLQQMQAMYNYSQIQDKANKQEIINIRLHQTILLVVITIISLFIIGLFVGGNFYRRQRAKSTQMVEQHLNDLSKLRQSEEKLKEVMANGRKEKLDIIEKTQLTIKILRDRLNEEGKKDIIVRKGHIDRQLQNSYICLRFHGLASNVLTPATDEEWAQLRNLVEMTIPNFYETINAQSELDIKAYRICLLTRLKFKPFEISNLCNIKPSDTSMIRKRMLKRIWGIEGSPEMFDKKVRKIC